jgi:hypothetical protein
MRKLVDDIGCAVCLFFCRNPDGSRCEGSKGSIHHIQDGSRRISHNHILPLCHLHHQAGTEGHPSRHSDRGDDGGLAEFEAAYATEMELVVMCEEWINQPYVTGLTDDQTTHDDDSDTDTHADDQPDDGHAREEVERLQTFDTPVHIRITHHRARLCDPDNLNAKGVIDAIVAAKILRDDSAKYVQSIRHDQVKVASYADEKTVITLEEVVS